MKVFIAFIISLMLSVVFAKVPRTRKEMKTEIMRDLIQDLKDQQTGTQIIGVGNSFGPRLPIGPTTTTYLIKVTRFPSKIAPSLSVRNITGIGNQFSSPILRDLIKELTILQDLEDSYADPQKIDVTGNKFKGSPPFPSGSITGIGNKFS